MRLMPQMLAVALIAAGVAIVHAEEPTTKPAKREPHGPRLVLPYAKMTTLTPEEKEKISELHKKAVDEKKVIDDKEEADINALLTDPQKAELLQINEDMKAKMKSKEADRKKPTTEPAKM